MGRLVLLTFVVSGSTFGLLTLAAWGFEWSSVVMSVAYGLGFVVGQSWEKIRDWFRAR